MLKNLKKIQSKTQGKIEENKSKRGFFKAEGMREAILDIVKAFQGFKKNLFH